jgi:hypothetical protein
MNKTIKDRFNECLDLDKIRSKVTVRPEPVANLGSFETMIAAEQLDAALKQIYLPNDFSLNFIREVCGRASMHSEQLFTSPRDYNSKVNNPPEVEVSPICLTGLAGVGKSQTIAALLKVLPQPMDFSCDLFEGTVRLRSHWYASARGKGNGKALLASFVHEDASKKLTVDLLLQQCRRIANLYGISLMVLDETQHINTGLGVAKVTEILLSMAAIGPPMIYVSNYSLIRKLLRRNSEDKQRFLANPRIMMPDAPGSQSWLRYVAECKRVAEGCIKADTHELAHELHCCTFGVKRLAVQLLKLAYIECRSAGRRAVDMVDLTRAYRSAAYTVSADEVETLGAIAIKNYSKNKNLDLQCPFDIPTEMTTNVVNFLKEDRQDRFNTAVFESSLSEGERAAKKLLDIPDGDRPQAAKKPPRAPVVKLNPEEQATAFLDYVDGLTRPKPEKPS